MPVTRFEARRVEKVWGRRDLPDMFGGAHSGPEPVGEIWFEHPDGRDVALLVKYLFTSEKLSIQVHPDDRAAAAAGYRRSKDEAWVVLRTDPDATIGIGMRQGMSREALRRAVLDGSIEHMLDWRPARAGDIYYSPAGTVHALGPGLMLIEIQQNADLTYRLYDYGRPRELHLDEGVAAANPVPYRSPMSPYLRADGRELLAEGGVFVLERWSRPFAGALRADAERPVWLVPVVGDAAIGDEALAPGTAWLVDGDAPIRVDADAQLLVAYPGGEVRDALLG